MRDRNLHCYQVDLLPYLRFELQQAERTDLANQIDEIHRSYEDTGALDIVALNEIVQQGLVLNLSAAVIMTTDRLISQVIDTTLALRKFSGSRVCVESLVACRVQARLAEQMFDAGALSDALAECDEAAAELATLVKPAQLQLDVMFADFAELIEAEVRLRLQEVADTMDSENSMELDIRLHELPDELTNEFDDEIREPLAEEFQTRHGVSPGELISIDATELSDERNALLTEWEVLFSAAASEFLKRVYEKGR